MDIQDEDFTPKSVMVIDDKKIALIVMNPLYTPILSILRGGNKTLKEIKSEYKDHTKKVKIPSDKSLYRHLKILTEAGLIAQAGMRVSKNQTMTAKLFGRTAVFFYARVKEDIDLDSAKHKNRAKLLANILKIAYDVPQPSTDCVLRLMKKIRANYFASHDKLFEDKVDDMVKMFGDAPAKDLQAIVETYTMVNLLVNSADFQKELKECLKT
ncbi:MAG: hypothetical protein ACTSQF_01790 [Candidatus Heimdallarchaeaceae archaeon]